MTIAEINQLLLEGKDLRTDIASELIRELLDESVGDGAKGAALALMQRKGVTGGELRAMVQDLRRQIHIEDLPTGSSILREDEEVVDTCGTGGGPESFNLSTAAAFIVAGAGAKVAKHGNRAVTSKCGSADVLEALGVAVAPNAPTIRRCLNEAGITFLFAPSHYQVMKAVASARRQLGFRTIFNLIGPLSNPLGASRQLIGVYDLKLLEPVIDSVANTFKPCVYAVHAEDGLDEVSPCTTTDVRAWEDDQIKLFKLSPECFGMDRLPPEAIAPGETLAEAAEIVSIAISDPESERFLAVLPNAATTLKIAGKAADFEHGAQLARESVASGAALACLNKLIEVSHTS